MSRRRNNVRGPTSALTEFLRESGINPDTIARRVATQNHQAENQSPSVAGPSNSGDNAEGAPEQEQQGEDVPQASNGRRTQGRSSRAIDYASDELDDPEEGSPAKKRKGTKGRATAAAKAKAKKKAKENEDYEGSSEDEYRAVSKNIWSMGGNGGTKPPVGSFENCAKCEKQFTVTKYTMAANPPPGYLCHPCSKASGNDPFKKPAVPRKRKPVADKRDIVSYEERRFPTLAAMCIELITRYIDDVEALGDIGSMNMDEIAKALSKNRGLTPENAHLFYDVLNKKLRFYDATNLTPDALATLASLNPNLTHLHLDYCGRLTSPVLLGFATSMPQLTSLTLLGPFLVRVEAWIEFFKAMPCLRVFKITQSPRINLKCVQTLAESCTKLEELSLREIGLMDDTFADPLCSLLPLRVLDLAFPGIGIDEDGWIRLMEKHGSTLETLDASKHEGFTDHVLLDGVRKYARVLLELKLQECLDLTDEGVAQFFTDWASPISTLKHEDDDDMDVDSAPVDISPVPLEEFTPNPPLHVLSLSRNHELSSAALTAAIMHSAQSLTWLNVNGLRGASPEALAELKRATELRYLDAGWCRELDDFVMKDVVTACTKLSEIKVWGCSRVRGIGWGVKPERTIRVHGIEPSGDI
ncbi:RNI-like protein [Rhizopogon vinicolor AM-OR11-026]|uniref:RNI-like protein n=1 Tax=Rhizopogon vinicolor AM-OR11-026 TaxID=1314800 RepID=A0A1B7MQX6_9AGAM|nr:RNI-like protein [Rhizopogon vinicolor AM-OR11-026]